MKKQPSTPPPPALVATAFIAVYLVWGSTYLGIRFAVESMPPFLMGAVRFLIAGGILFAILRLRGVPNPAAAHWRNAAIIGTLLIGVGNGGVSWAEQKVPSNIAALLIGATPIWFVLMDWLRPGGVRPSGQSLTGVLIGFVGVVLLVSPQSDSPLTLSGAVAILIASFCWAGGSLFARYTPKPDNPLMGVALQMLTGAGSLFLASLLSREPSHLEWSRISAKSIYALVYLIVIGALVGFTAYSWLLKNTTPAKLSTYAYVNPVIAVFLGWFLADEILNTRTLGAAAIIIIGVMTILIRRPPPPPIASPINLKPSQ